MLRNTIGPIFRKPSSFCRENEIFENKTKTQKLGPVLNTKRANIGPILTLQHIERERARERYQERERETERNKRKHTRDMCTCNCKFQKEHNKLRCKRAKRVEERERDGLAEDRKMGIAYQDIYI